MQTSFCHHSSPTLISPSVSFLFLLHTHKPCHASNHGWLLPPAYSLGSVHPHPLGFPLPTFSLESARESKQDMRWDSFTLSNERVGANRTQASLCEWRKETKRRNRKRDKGGGKAMAPEPLRSLQVACYRLGLAIHREGKLVSRAGGAEGNETSKEKGKLSICLPLLSSEPPASHAVQCPPLHV